MAWIIPRKCSGRHFFAVRTELRDASGRGMAQRFAEWKPAFGIPEARRSVFGHCHHALIVRTERGIKNITIVLHGRSKRFSSDGIPNARGVISRSSYQAQTIMTETERMDSSKVAQDVSDRLSRAC